MHKGGVFTAFWGGVVCANKRVVEGVNSYRVCVQGGKAKGECEQGAGGGCVQKVLTARMRCDTMNV